MTLRDLADLTLQLRLPLLTVAGLGLLMGWVTASTAPMMRRGWALVTLAALVLLGGLVVSALAVMPGRGGLWLDMASFMAISYTAGCILGSALRKLALRLGARSPPS